jgi:hypothetical protein
MASVLGAKLLLQEGRFL